MKFITEKGAPDIPLEILEAQESDQLIFFCGAGIEIPVGLPNFEGLVKSIYKYLTVEQNDQERQAIKNKLYDQALYLLETRISPNGVRHAIMNKLSIDQDADLPLHKAILELSKTKEHNYRLVTTNVSHGFRLAEPNFKLQIDAAPRLPVPKPHKWQSIVYLHGIIDKKYDPNGKNLIFTSADFGSAYLTERWASRFVTDLFAHFTVLFIGYSVNDPVIRYMTDAIAAEQRLGYQRFKQPYVIAGAKQSEFEKETTAWLAKGVKPILYSYRGKNHSNLYKTLKAWAAYSRDGLNAKIRFIKQFAPIKPLPPYDQDNNVQRIVDILKEKTDVNHSDISGLPSQAFKDINNPPAPIEWLSVLYEKGLLSIAGQKTSFHPVSAYHLSNIQVPNKITYNLWSWLLHHFESDVLVEWIIEQGGCVHPELKQLIKDKLESKGKPKEPYLTFWRLVISDYLQEKPDNLTEGYEIIQALGQGIGNIPLNLIIVRYIEPRLKLKKAFTWPGELASADDEQPKHKPYEAEAVIGLSDCVYKEWKSNEGYPQKYINLLLPVTEALNKALMLWELIGNADTQADPSFWCLTSIEKHSQNQHLDSWVFLIELCRDLWDAAWELNRPLASAILQLWKSLEYPVFRRLILYAYTCKPVVDADTALNYLLENEAWWLWSLGTHREKFRLLEKIWPQLSTEGVEKLQQKILIGPPRGMYRDDLQNKEWKELVDHKIWLLLTKLESFGRNVMENAKLKLSKLYKKYPDWTLPKDNRDEFIRYIESGWGYKKDITKEEFCLLPIPELVEKLLEINSTYREGRIDLCREVCKEEPQKAVEILTYLKKQSIWDQHIWHAGLVGLADSENPCWLSIANLLINADVNLFVEESWAIAFWTKKAAKNIKTDSKDEKYFWLIISKIFDVIDETMPSSKIDLNEEIDFINKAINHPVGIITEALLERFAQRKLEVGNGIPELNYLTCINRIMDSKVDSYLMGKIILASRLYYFYVIDPIWTKVRLLPKFNWELCTEAQVMWDGYLWSPITSIELALELKNLILIALSKSDLLFNQSKQLHHLFAFICLEYLDVYSTKEQQQALTKIGKQGLIDIAEYMWQSLSRIDEKDRDVYWENRIKPFILNVWPKTIDFTNEKIAEYLSLMSIQLNKSFADSLNTFALLLVPFDDLFSYFFVELDKKFLVDENPMEVFNLITKIFAKQDASFPKEIILKVFKRLIEADSEISNQPYFEIIKNHLLKYGIEI